MSNQINQMLQSKNYQERIKLAEQGQLTFLHKNKKC